MNEFNEYIKKVMWYCEKEYYISSCTIEEFENSPNANILLNHCFSHFASNSSFQNCACSLVVYLKEFYGGMKK